MASLDRSHCPVVESVPGKVSGAWVFKGTRTPVAIVFDNLEHIVPVENRGDNLILSIPEFAVPEVRAKPRQRLGGRRIPYSMDDDDGIVAMKVQESCTNYDGRFCASRTISGVGRACAVTPGSDAVYNHAGSGSTLCH